MRKNDPTHMYTSSIKITTMRQNRENVGVIKIATLVDRSKCTAASRRLRPSSAQRSDRSQPGCQPTMSGEEEVREHEEEEETTTTTEVEVRVRRPTREGIHSRCARVVYTQAGRHADGAFDAQDDRGRVGLDRDDREA